MAAGSALLFDVVFLLLATLHLLLAPYTKVEESFAMQATHDLLFTTSLDQFDHLEFSGVVPRSFSGPLLLSGLSLPCVKLIAALGYEKRYAQYVVRFMLALLYTASFSAFRRAVAALYADDRLANLITIVSHSRAGSELAAEACCDLTRTKC